MASRPAPLLTPELDGDVEVRHSPELGRHVVAVKPIERGAVVIMEKPVVVGVSGASCANCTRMFPQEPSSSCSPRSRSWWPCASCGVPLCSPDCRGALHTAAECALLRKRVLHPIYEMSLLDFLAILRVLMLPAEERTRVFLTLESNEGRGGLRSDFMRNALAGLEGIAAMFGNTFSHEDVLRATCIVTTNAFDYGAADGSFSGQALYEQLSLFSHSCVANARFVEYGRSESDFLGAVVADLDIPAGSVVSVCYVDRMAPTRKRRETLITGKLFLCRCARCEDPTELGLYSGNICCLRCHARKRPLSLLLPHTENARSGVLYRCSACSFEVNQSEMDGLVADILERYPHHTTAPDALERFLNEQLYPAGVLHPTFHAVLEAKMELVEGVYGHADRYSFKDMSESELQRKLALCRELLHVMNVIAPGLSCHRGYLLLETIPTLLEIGWRSALKSSNRKKPKSAASKKRPDRAGVRKCWEEASDSFSELALIFTEPLKKRLLEKLQSQIQNLSQIIDEL